MQRLVFNICSGADMVITAFIRIHLSLVYNNKLQVAQLVHHPD